MGKILRVDLTGGTCAFEDPAPEEELLGGRGLTSHIVSREVAPETDPLGPGNVLVVAPGLLGGTSIPNSGRLSVGAKSPLTGGIKEANSGGSVARKLARLGVKAVVVEGEAGSPSLIHVDAGGASVRACPDLAGLGTVATVDRLRTSSGDHIGVVCIGPAGEQRLKAAAVIVTTPDFRLRSAARGGLGAVMGAKNLKALVVDDSQAPALEPAKPDLMKTAASELSAGIQSHPAMGALEALGSAFLVNMANGFGCLATKNFSAGQFADAEKISGETMAGIMAQRPNAQSKHRCMVGCVVNCSQVYTGTDGEEITSGFEYETLGLLGSNCLISDMDQLARINALCDDLGLDTMEVGAAMGVAMDAGILSWGDGAAAHDLIAGSVKGDVHGMLIGNGCVDTGRALGVTRIPAVKGQGIAAWEPRVLKGTGVTYATSPMGADHTNGNAIPSPTNPDYNPSSPTGQAQMSQFLQAYNAAVDTLGFCLFPSLALLDMPHLWGHLADGVEAVTGKAIDKEDYLVKLGMGVLAEEVAFNRAVGFTRADDALPAFMTTEALPPSGNVFDVSKEDIDSVFA